jgi:hypothetical protein
MTMSANDFACHPPEFRNRHEERPAGVASLPFHPVDDRSLNHGRAPAFRLRHRFRRFLGVEKARLRLGQPKWGVELHMTKLMGQRRPQPILPPRILDEVSGDAHIGLSSGSEVSDPFDILTLGAQVSIEVEVRRLSLDQDNQVIGRDRIPHLPVSFPEEAGDKRFALGV